MRKTSKIRPNVVIDEFIVMPNHINSIIIIDECRGTLQRAHYGLKEIFSFNSGVWMILPSRSMIRQSIPLVL